VVVGPSGTLTVGANVTSDWAIDVVVVGGTVS